MHPDPVTNMLTLARAMKRRMTRYGIVASLAALGGIASCREPVAPGATVTAASNGETAVAAAARAHATTATTFKVDAVTVETRYWDSTPWYVNPESVGWSTCDPVTGLCNVWTSARVFPGRTAPGATFDTLSRSRPGYSNRPVAVSGIGCSTVTPWNTNFTPDFPSGLAKRYLNCLGNPGDGASAAKNNIATRYRVRVSGGSLGGTFQVRFGVDFMGGALLIDGVVQSSNWMDPSWYGFIDTPIYPGVPGLPQPWTYDALWTTDSAGGFVTSITMAPNQTRVIDVIGFENGDDYGGMIQFAGGDGVWMDAESLNLQMPLTVALGSAGGRITAGSLIDCPTTCTNSFPWGTRPVVTPVPDEFFALSTWSGACSGTGTCEPIMNSPQSVTGSFVRVQWPVTVTKAGSGLGTVTSGVAGINCGTGGTACRAGFNVGSNVVLTATPLNGATVAWTGCTSTSGNTCTLRNLAAATSVTATFTQVASKLALSAPAAGATSGAVFSTQPVVAIQDAGGIVVTGNSSNVVMSVSAGGTLIGTVTKAAVNGIATFSGVGLSGPPGTYTLTFSSGTLTTATQTIAMATGVAAQITVTTSAAGAPSGAPFATQPVVAVRDATGNIVNSGAVITMLVTGPGGVAWGYPVATALNGVATFVGVGIIGTAGTSYTLTYVSLGLTSASQVIVPTAGTATQLAITRAAAGAASGAAFTTQPVVAIRDGAGNVVANSTASVTMAVSMGGTVIGTATVAAVGGVATFSGVGLSGAPGTYDLTFSSGTLAPTGQNIALTAGAATRLALTAPATAAASGAPFTTPPVVVIKDATGNTVTTSSAVVAMTVSAGGSVVGTSSVPALNGVAIFANAGISGVIGTTYTLTFASTGLTSASQSIGVTAAGAPSRLVLTRLAAGAASGAAFATQPQVSVLDAAGNVTASGAVVSMTVAGVGGAVVGPNSATAVNGVATFSNVGLSGTAGTSYTLTFASAGLTPATQSIVPSAGSAAQIAVNAGNNQTAAAGSAVGVPPSVVVRDASGNPVAGVQVAFAVLTGGGSAAGTTPLTNAAGIATVGGWTLGATPGPNTMSASATGLNGSPVVFTATGALNDTPRALSCSATPAVLWPVNHKLVDITVKLPAGAFVLDAVTSNEPLQWLGDGTTPADAAGWSFGTADVSGQLRAERAGLLRDRVYTMLYSGRDGSGFRATASCTVTVPHDQGKP